MHKSKIKQISLAVCLAFMPFSGFAAGLGKLNMNSGLGEPLRAEVELLSVTPEELSTLVATIAPEEAYAVQGITRLGIHNNIKVELAKNTDGSPVLKLRSTQPISDPYLDVLLQVDWASGRLLREYTVLLDPPSYKAPSNETSFVPVSPPSSASSKLDKSTIASGVAGVTVDDEKVVTKKSKKLKKAINQVTEQQDASATSAADGGQLITVRGDTLNSIAREMQVEGVSLDQMLVGLYENNKDAFSSGNMNRLKVGQIIKTPSKETLVAIDSQQARQAIKIHSANWNEYRSSLAGTVAQTPAAAESEQKQSASGKIATAEDKAAPIKAGAQDVVKLSAGLKEDGHGSKDAGKDFEAKISALQEEATAREKALKESLDRAAALEKQIDDMQKLLALKNQTMTDLQKNAETAAAAPVAAQPDAAKPAEVQPPPAPEVKKAAPVVKPPVEAAPEQEPSFIQSLLGDIDLTVLGGAAGLGLLGAGWLFLRNKRRKDLDSFERGILTSGGLRANTVFGNTTGNASTSDTSFLTDFAQSADGSMIDTNDVDPIAEAEVYMAYGRDAQAEEILKDAITKEPKRYELHLKLLEMYAGRKETSAFETIAGELYTTLGADDPTWAKVAELGATIEPENPLYDTSKSGALGKSATQELDASDFADTPVATDDALDFSLGEELASSAQPEVEDANSVVMQSFPEVGAVEHELSFDLGTLDEQPLDAASAAQNVTESVLAEPVASSDFAATSAKEADNLTDPEDAADNSMDFDLSELSPQVTASDASDEAPSSVALAPAESFAAALDVSGTTADLESDETDFGLEFELPAVEAESVPAAVPETTLSAISDISFDLDLPETPAQVTTEQEVEKVEEISFDLPSSDVVASVDAEDAPDLTANEFDFNSINLDLGDDAQVAAEQVADDLSVELTSPVTSENQDVDIKLDLVAAYIDMDDKEGAKELLDEVIKEGGPQQRQRAEQLLASLA